MAKVQVDHFDRKNCEGCPHRQPAGGGTQAGPLIDALADLEAGILGGVTGAEQHKCGLCGCPLVNLEATNLAPGGCPRLDQHDGGQF